MQWPHRVKVTALIPDKTDILLFGELCLHNDRTELDGGN